MSVLKALTDFFVSNVILRGVCSPRIQSKSVFPSMPLVLSGVCAFALAAPAQLIPSADGKTVYDAHLHARWLANANLAGTPAGTSIASQAGISTISPGGAMNYSTAIAWLTALNTQTFGQGVGYLGHTTWTLPTSPTDVTNPQDANCTSSGPGGDRFGYGCTVADMAGLYNLKQSLGLKWPNTAVPILHSAAGPFRNLQPYLYWTKTAAGDLTGFHTFSFNTGWTGANTNNHYMYVLPMIKGKVTSEYNGTVLVSYVSAGVGALQVSTDGQLVYDPAPVNVTFLADASLARSQSFGAQCTSFVPPEQATVFPPGIPCIAPDGSMANNTAGDTSNANSWINGMNAYNGTGWLGRQDWQLPPDDGGCGNFGCADSPMGDLYYNQLVPAIGTPVVQTPNINVGPFNHVQPYLYWSCGEPVTSPPCQTIPPRVPTQEWSFSFGNGFQGTDLQINSMYVMVYFQQTPSQALIEAIEKDLSTNRVLNAILEQANDIIAAPNARAKFGALVLFAIEIEALRGRGLNAAQAEELIELALIV